MLELKQALVNPVHSGKSEALSLSSWPAYETTHDQFGMAFRLLTPKLMARF
ncbi:hypothetical protein [Bradyrhizobium sp. CCBAU 11361]|uniref:hypothetical protein n=1 Tax=Bradyrhizobium sp. CCBAU 11361 TaxID=1630812 RepID=UPI002302083D|nr:hypothetical protein [Bradyrhizobium sp. CCBAU 11361]